MIISYKNRDGGGEPLRHRHYQKEYSFSENWVIGAQQGLVPTFDIALSAVVSQTLVRLYIFFKFVLLL